MPRHGRQARRFREGTRGEDGSPDGALHSATSSEIKQQPSQSSREKAVYGAFDLSTARQCPEATVYESMRECGRWSHGDYQELHNGQTAVDDFTCELVRLDEVDQRA